ncbi:MAG: hypothetical protein U5N58_14860 [Actinomycetota bacterium]|nr:hypothetical protein [Actinomycetota bacterium]
MDKKKAGFIAAGAVIGAALGYILSRIGTDRVLGMLREKNIISPEIINLIDDFKKGLQSG